MPLVLQLSKEDLDDDDRPRGKTIAIWLNRPKKHNRSTSSTLLMTSMKAGLARPHRSLKGRPELKHRLRNSFLHPRYRPSRKVL